MSRKIEFIDLDEARLKAGFFVDDVKEFLGISRRTWYRWKAKNEVPKWAYVALSVKSGDLTELGWKGFFIESGVLYRSELSRTYYNWKPADLMVTVFCNCHSHMYLREQRKGKIINTPTPTENNSLITSLHGNIQSQIERKNNLSREKASR